MLEFKVCFYRMNLHLLKNLKKLGIIQFQRDLYVEMIRQ